MKTRSTAPWPVADAKARLSELIDKALTAGPQVITRNGRPTAVLVSAEEWQRKARRRGNLAEFFANSPLRDSGLRVKRPTDRPRDLDL